IYRHGVMSIDDYDRLQNESRKRIRAVSDNVAVSLRLKDVFTPKSAYDYIMTQDTMMYSREVLKTYNINELLQQNLTYDKNRSEEELAENLQNISYYNGFVQAGQKIVDRGETVTDEVYDVLRSYEKEYERRNIAEVNIPYKTLGQTLYVLIVFITLTFYLSLFRSDYFENVRNVTLLFVLPVLFCVIAALMVSHKTLNVFMLPYCMVPIVIRIFMDSRTAFMFHCGMILIISLFLTSNYEFLILQLVVGMAAIQSLRELSQRSQIVRTAFVLFLIYGLVYTGYSLHHENAIKMDNWMYACFGINCILLLFTYPLLWMLEKVFGFTSDVTLVELSSVRNPLLQRMTEVAPGTFQHSMQVANLSAEVANKIGAKTLLVRTGALYHDIGKIERSVFFTENQSGVSPHKHLSALKSAEVIIAHVKNGVALAEKHHLPESIKRFITTHHGSGKAKYFYITYKNEHPDEEVDEAAFTYPGPNPGTKEEAILMMCDSVEAASRSLPEYTEESINRLVDKIIDSQVSEGFFNECSITFKEIAMAKAVLKDKLKTIYHTRISYPELAEATENVL
ncbi:MAG: HDIG domain-containing protein, partial [Bacteroidaceae bacterium]|nr:HDIG domain-containing protein [Bacteroidaceae bacterium]